MINRVFVGFDERQPVSFATLAQSIITKTSKPISITPLILRTLPSKRTGLTPFTFTRFLVPWLCGYEGWAAFLDVDMLLVGDISELFDMQDANYAAMVVKNPARRFEWASLILFNCTRCRVLTPEYVETADGLHTLQWLREGEIGALPSEWNHLVGYDPPRDDAKLLHYTQGIPAFPETQHAEHGNKWREIAASAFSSAPWATLMGKSVHAQYVLAERNALNADI